MIKDWQTIAYTLFDSKIFTLTDVAETIHKNF